MTIKSEARLLHFLPKINPLSRHIPYFGHVSVQLKIRISKLISEYFSAHRPSYYLVNRFKVESFSNSKTLYLAYEYCCAKCASVYYVSSIRTLHTRTAKHKPISPRTGRLLVRHPRSSILDHALSYNSDINLCDFRVVASVRYEIPLRITKSIFFLQKSPKQNDLDLAFPLKLFPPPTLFSS